MKNWRQFTSNPEALASVFGSLDPSLERISILGIEIPQPISYLSISLSLDDYPEKPPRRWPQDQGNALSITLVCSDVTSLILKRKLGGDKVSCLIRESVGDAIERVFELEGEGIELRFACSWIRVGSIRPCTKDELETSL